MVGVFPFKFEDINYAVASREDKETMFLEYSELLNSLDSGAATKMSRHEKARDPQSCPVQHAAFCASENQMRYSFLFPPDSIEFYRALFPACRAEFPALR